MTMWELNMQAEAQKRNDHKMINMLRNHASIVISPYAKKGASINPRKIWPIEGEYIPKATSKESFRRSLEFFRNRNWKVKKVIN